MFVVELYILPGSNSPCIVYAPSLWLCFQATLLKPSPKSKPSKHILKTSPESSRSSSRNSSVSPRERPSSSLKNRASPPGGGLKRQPKKSSSDNRARPLVPWSKRNLGPAKNCNGWSWVDEGFEQKVYLNVSYLAKDELVLVGLHVCDMPICTIAK